MKRNILILMVALFVLLTITTNVYGKNNINYVNNINIARPSSNMNIKRIPSVNPILLYDNNKIYVYGSFGSIYLYKGQLYDYVRYPHYNPYVSQVIQENGGTRNIYSMYVNEKNGIVIFKNGKAYGWGYSENGIIQEPYEYPTELTDLENLIQQNGGIDNIYRIIFTVMNMLIIFKDGSIVGVGRLPDNDGQWMWSANINHFTNLTSKYPAWSKFSQIIKNDSSNIYDILYAKNSYWSPFIIILKNGSVYYTGYNYLPIYTGEHNEYSSVFRELRDVTEIIQQNGGVENIYNIVLNYERNIIIIFKNGKVYVWGDNWCGQLGLNDTIQRTTPTENTYLEQIIQENGGADNIFLIRSLGGMHGWNILIFKNGKVYVWGGNWDGQLGLGDTTNRNTPTENTQLEQIIQDNGGVDNILTLKTGWWHNILIFKNGKVYVWGWNNVGQLGLGDTHDRDTPTENTQLEQLIQENGGTENIYTIIMISNVPYSVLIFRNGKVYVFGNGLLQMGAEYNRYLLPEENTNTEQFIPTVNDIYYYGPYYLILKNGLVYNFGVYYYYGGGTGEGFVPLSSSQYLQSSTGGQIKEFELPYNITNVLSTIQTTGPGYYIIETAQGLRYFGMTDAVSRGINVLSKPMEIPILSNFISNNGGINNIEYLALSTIKFRNGKIYVPNRVTSTYGPLQISTNIKFIRNNGAYYLLIDKNGKIYTTSTRYNINNQTVWNQLYNMIDGVNNIYDIIYSGDAVMVITRNGKVYVWGHNYYGKLGLGDTTDRYTPTENTYLEQIIQQNGGVENISMITFGYIIFNNNKVYRWGTYEIYKPTEAPQLEGLISQKGIKGIWINSGYLFILTNTNELYRYTMYYDYSIHAPKEYIVQLTVLPETVKLPKIIDSTTTTTINFVL